MPRTSPRLVLAAVRAAAGALWRAARAAVLPGAVAALAAAPAVAAPPVFAITSIAEGCLARFLNDKAQTVVVCGEEYLWTPGEGMKPIADPRFSNEWMTTHALNNHGVVTGMLETRFGPPPDHPTHSFVGPAGGPMQRISHWDHHILAFGLNDAGVVVGQAWKQEGTEVISHAFRWTGDTPALSPGARESAAFHINARGEIVGQRYTGDGSARAVKRGVGGRVQPLVPTMGSSYGASLNHRGDVVGEVTVPGQGVKRAFVAWHNQPPLFIDRRDDPRATSVALGVNDRRQVVGKMTWAPDHAEEPFYWDEQVAGPVKLMALLDPDDPLRTRIVSLSSPLAINNAGQVLVHARDANGVVLPVLLTPLAGR